MRLSSSKILVIMKADVLSIEVVGLPANSLSSVLCWTSNVWDQGEIVLRSVNELPTSSKNSNVCRRTTERKVSILTIFDIV